MNGIFTISLDFELHWGGFEKWPVEDYRRYFLNTRKVIPEMLKLFSEHEVHVTWAGVGLLFHKNKADMERNFPALKPTYAQQELSAYHFMSTTGIGTSEEEDPLHFGAGLVKQIAEEPGQELGSHTFAHFYCNEPGQTSEQFRDDLRAAQKASLALTGKRLRSLVFPRNQFNDDYLKVCYSEGFIAVRDNPRDWFWHIRSTQHESAWKRLNRGADAYFPIGKENTYALSAVEARDGFPVCLPASRLLRPYRPSELFLNAMKIRRVRAEMERAAQKNEVYHLWWHPHNFGHYPAESIRGLKEILKAYRHCKNKFGMSSLTMGETAELITGNGKNKTA